MRYTSIIYLLPIIFILLSAEGCKEGCDDVICAPVPPLLTVILRDTITALDTVRRYDTTLADTVDDVDTVVVVRATTDAVVTLHTLSSGVAGSVFDTVRTIADSSFTYDDRSRSYSGEFALVALRGTRADTLTGIFLQRVEGCCPYEVLGSYSMRLPER